MNEFKNRILQGDSLEVLQGLPDGLVNTCVTSPPYWGLRDYGVDGQLVAAKREGFDYIGIEREAEYIEIAKARIGEKEKIILAT